MTLTEDGDDLLLQIGEDYEASSSLPGLYLYLTNNINSTANAFEIGMVDTFAGAHTYRIEDIGVNDYDHVLYYCKPFRVKVGDGSFDN